MEFLFKYFGHPTNAPLENGALKVLKGLSLKVTPPAEFNDPFELTPVLSPFATKEEALGNIRNAILGQKSGHSLPKDFRIAMADAVLNLAKNQGDLNYCVQQSVPLCISQEYGIVCFSSVPNQLLMWAHYASTHTGIMLEFDTSAPLFKTENFFHVIYRNQRVIFDQKKSSLEQLKRLAQRKCPDWKYEKESRLIVPLAVTEKRSGFYFLKIEPEWVKSITVGARACPEIKNQTKILGRQWKHLEIYRMSMDEKTFSLRRDKMEHF
jgi:hypothetical protein